MAFESFLDQITNMFAAAVETSRNYIKPSLRVNGSGESFQRRCGRTSNTSGSQPQITTVGQAAENESSMQNPDSNPNFQQLRAANHSWNHCRTFRKNVTLSLLSERL